MQRTRLSSPTVLRHPNVMSEAERLALPDPCAPINRTVVPAGQGFAALLGVDNGVTPAPHTRQGDASQYHQTDTGFALSFEKTLDITQFIQGQQRDSQLQPCKLRLPLSLLPRLVKAAGLGWWAQMMQQHPTLALNQRHNTTTSDATAADAQKQLSQLETQLYLMGQMYHTMLCVFLLCQCKSRKTLNQQVTLQDLTDAINAYVKAHQTELEFLTQHDTLLVEPPHVEFAITALGWPISKYGEVAQRHTTISSQNPLTGC